MRAANLLLSYYRKGTERKLRKMLELPNRTPYMKYKEMDVIAEILQNLRPVNCLEYGCGFSSLHFPALLPSGAKWLSVEHNSGWFDTIRHLNANPNVRLVNVPPENPDFRAEGTLTDFWSYVNYPASHAPYDFIFVDGMAREACVQRAFDWLTDDGVLLLHDCNRSRYHKSLHLFPNVLIMEDFRKRSGGIGIATKTIAIDQLLDVELHKKIWQADSSISNFFKLKFLIGRKTKPFKFQWLSHAAQTARQPG